MSAANTGATSHYQNKTKNKIETRIECNELVDVSFKQIKIYFLAHRVLEIYAFAFLAIEIGKSPSRGPCSPERVRI